MTELEPQYIQDQVFRHMAELAGRPQLQAEIARAEREFFGANPSADPTEGSNAARFSEWFLMERESEQLGEVPVRLAGTRIPEAALEAMQDSRVGVFLVQQTQASEITVLDLQDDSSLELAPLAGAEVRPGDLLIGRLYPDALDRHVGSWALAAQRDAEPLAAAFCADIERLGLGRRLTQAEIEHLLFRGRVGPEVAAPEVPLERLEAELDSLLGASSLDGWSAAGISRGLAEAQSPGPVVDPVLAQVAFHSELEIEKIQRLLMDLWNAHRLKPSPQAAPATPRKPEQEPQAQPEPRTESHPRGKADEGLGEQLARRIEEGMARHENVEQLFGEIGAMIGEDLSEPDIAQPGDGTPSPGDTGIYEGDLPALVREYCWETDQESGPDQELLERLVQLQRQVAEAQLDVEQVQNKDLSRFLMQIYLDTAPGQRAKEVVAAFQVVQRFYAWVHETQQIDLDQVVRATDQEVVQQVSRLDVAGMLLSSPSPGRIPDGCAPVVSRVVHVAGPRVDLALEPAAEPVVLESTPEVGQNLREGDLLLGPLQRQADGSGTFVGMVVAMPAVAGGFID